jgi:hypothetical protein
MDKDYTAEAATLEFLDAAALAALPTCLANDYSEHHEQVATRAYRVADAMAAEKKRRAEYYLAQKQSEAQQQQAAQVKKKES